MDTLHCGSVDALTAAIGRYGPGALYRGQVQHFSGPDGFPSLSTSFQRGGCIPDLMMRWMYYARRALDHLVKGWEAVGDLATDQAILQHYGWRSFFLDASGDPRVASWFASHKFESNMVVNMVEDCFEDPVWLRTLDAKFVPADGIGNLYVICKKALRRRSIQAVHLAEIATREGIPRYVRQDAYMVGPLIQAGLSGDCVLCHVTAPTDVFRELAEGLSTAWLFPEPSNDPVYRELLSMPWEKLRHVQDGGLECFKRALELPEYSSHLQKHMPARSAMYRPFWTRDLPPPPGHQGKAGEQIVQILCGSSLYHGSSEPQIRHPQIVKLLEACEEISIEYDGLVYHGMDCIYGKGVGVVKVDGDVFCVFEYGVEHPGLRIMDVRRFYGMHYRIADDGVWERFAHEDDCNCGSEHAENFKLLGRVDQALEEGWIQCVEPGLYVQKGVDPTSDRRATWGEPY